MVWCYNFNLYICRLYAILSYNLLLIIKIIFVDNKVSERICFHFILLQIALNFTKHHSNLIIVYAITKLISV